MEIIANNFNEGLRVDLLRPKYVVGQPVWFVLQGRPVGGIVVGYQVDVLQSGTVENYNYKVGFVQVSPDGYSPAFKIIPEEALEETKEKLMESLIKSIEDATIQMPEEYKSLFMQFALGKA